MKFEEIELGDELEFDYVPTDPAGFRPVEELTPGRAELGMTNGEIAVDRADEALLNGEVETEAWPPKHSTKLGWIRRVLSRRKKRRSTTP